MELTAFGFVLLPLTLIFLLRPKALLQITLIVSAFGAAAPLVINWGDEPYGLQCGFLPGVLFVIVSALNYLVGRRREEEPVIGRIVTPLALFTACALAGAVVLPRLFAGQFQVWPQSVGTLNLSVPLAPNGGNITQSLYLSINAAVFVLAAIYVSRPGVRYAAFVRAYLISGYIVVALCLWQFASKLTGIYYPEDFLYSNPRWAILTEQAFGDVSRINGPFTEPAALAGYLAGIIFACLRLLRRGEGGSEVRLLLILSMLAILLSTSTTGIVVLTVFVPAILLRTATTRERLRIGLAVSTTAGAALVLTVVAYLGIPSVAGRIEAAASTVIEATLDKPESASYADRTTKDIDSVGVLVPSFGLGAGWGSVRTSSLIPGILANAGVAGLALLGWFTLGVSRLVAKARRLAPSGDARTAMEAMSASVWGTLCAAAVAAPSINEIDFFVRLAVAIGCATRIGVDACVPGTAPGATPVPPLTLPIRAPRSAS